ncbi:tRNA (guanine37-N1)-methyltransferase [Geosmithia morbida]|uniref:tRNA (guanine(37)-N1)-methyltransferase n=1 Tax=Geosmithia morbida TaxID=1094350 RepID=A0A9P5D5L9_9HYPO|nr:tRNA (guanine37-N1)-methyltransferase [Geosmithia morbida]KAF4122629.1 tRNA (guanine37-N1)-methyltransferase [Geosmithia morbida]
MQTDATPVLVDMSSLFRPPAAARAAQTLDRTLFSRTLPATAAVVRDNKLLSRYRKDFEGTRELLNIDKMRPIVAHPDPALARQGSKCLVLDPAIKSSVPETWSSKLKEALDAGELSLIPYNVDIDYTYWSYVDVVKSILPESLQNEVPSGFNSAGHVAHLNLREQYLPYKHVIAQVLLDKNPHIKTVINKTDNVGTENEFRTFSYEVLAGPDDMVVEVRESNCSFVFDYSKVYWNSKLSNEHDRLASLFQPGEVVADVMAGIGPFAVPAGKRGVFVWANDKNPESYRYLNKAVQRNKVSEFVRPFNLDGHDFIRQAADLVLEASARGQHATVAGPRPSRTSKEPPPPPTKVPVPPTVSHFVMNLPASAIEFLHDFRGLYHGHEDLFSSPGTEAQTQRLLPMVHVHCFAPKPNDDAAVRGVVERIQREIGVALQPGNGEVQGQATFHEVRDVAPNKLMFCVSFRLPPEVAFAPRT